jgi:hypothetical protein
MLEFATGPIPAAALLEERADRHVAGAVGVVGRARLVGRVVRRVVVVAIGGSASERDEIIVSAS